MPKTPKLKNGRSAAPRGKAKKGTLKRLTKMLITQNKGLLAVILICLVISALVGVASSLFLENLLTTINKGMNFGLDAVWQDLLIIFITMGVVYGIGILASFLYTRLGAVLTQRFLHQTRTAIFDKMQSLPIKYSDSHKTGDLMSIYTNDTDAMRQLISQSLPQLLSSVISLTALLVMMFTSSIWLTLVIFFGVFFMFFVTKKIGGNSAKYFIKQQKSLGATEGFVEEMIQGGKVIKVFCHEEESNKDFDKKNDELCEDATKAHTFANILMPIMGNIGNILYVLIAFVGGLLVILNVQNLTIMGFEPLYSSTEQVVNGVPQTLVVPTFLITIATFLPRSRQFAGNIAQSSQQINSIVMGLAGADRIFSLLDEPSETDNGYVTLVNCVIDENGNITETDERTGRWAWKHPHKADGTVTYTELKGDIQMFDVDFGYVPEKIVLHDVNLYAHPGQHLAFVGATGAGKTTITNLINRFYDIADG
ncbi:MAG: ABC transporter ATP-binding protein, partial [Clostridia bacterium]|nr:ABC transporter ATP-binding protein [Clostridia bacterium]